MDIDGKVKDLGIRVVNIGKVAVSVSAYPNPVTGNTLTINAGDEKLPANYRITDAQGKIIKTGILSVVQQKVNVQDLRAGIYFLQVGEQVIKLKK